MSNIIQLLKKRASNMSRRYRGKNRKNKEKVKAMAKVSEPVKTAGPQKTDIAKATSQAHNYRPNKAKNEGRKSVQEVTNAKMSGESLAILYQILAMKRPADSKTEKDMITQFIDPLGAKTDGYGNRIVQIPLEDGTPSKTLFSCHTDTVHKDEGTQKLYLDLEKQEIFVEDSDCLGADDGTGIYIMIRMINMKIPGTYIFHRAEEIGGQGSRFIKEKHGEWLKQFDRAIAFDRKNKDDVIIAQSAGIMASEAFGKALAKELNSTGLEFTNCKGGTFTDTANYCTFIGECINLSVGYDRQHTSFETQDLNFLQKLLPRLFYTKWEELPTVRKPGPAEPRYSSGWNGYQQRGNTQAGRNRPYSSGYGDYDDYGSYGRNIDAPVPKEKLMLLIMNEPRVALELLIALEPSKTDLWDAEWEAQTLANDMLDDFNAMYGNI